MSELTAEVFGIGEGLEVAVGDAPLGDGVDDAVDQLTDAGLAIRGAHLAVEIFTGDNVGRGL